MDVPVTQEREIWLPASVEKKPGHVKVGWNSIFMYSGKMCVGNTYPTISHAVTTCDSFAFFEVNSSIYYVNGRRGVYLTNIRSHQETFFDPVGRMADNTPVLFRKLHKIEWVFL